MLGVCWARGKTVPGKQEDRVRLNITTECFASNRPARFRRLASLPMLFLIIPSSTSSQTNDANKTTSENCQGSEVEQQTATAKHHSRPDEGKKYGLPA